MPKYQILQIVDGLGRGGVESFLYDLCKAQVARGNKVTLVSLIEPRVEYRPIIEDLNSVGVEFISLGASNRKEALSKWRLLKTILKDKRKQGPVVCNSHLKLGTLVAVLAKLGSARIALCETYHSQYKKYYLQHLLMRPFISKYIAVSQSAADEMIARFHVASNKIVVIKNGVDIQQLHKKAKREAHRKHIFVSVGRFTIQKNFTPVITAFSQINSSNAEYHIIGDGELKDEYIRAANNDNRIKFLGSVDRETVLNEIINSDALIMPSKWEGLSIVQLEAICLHVPLVLSNIKSFCEVMKEPELVSGERFRECEWGFLINENDIDGYKAIIESILCGNINIEKKREFLASLSREYDIICVAERYLSVYESIMK